MGVGQLSESDAVDALRLPFYSSSHPTGSHGWRNQFDLGNPDEHLFEDVDSQDGLHCPIGAPVVGAQYIGANRSSSMRGRAWFRKTSAQLPSRRLAFFGVTRNWDCQRLSCESRMRNMLPSPRPGAASTPFPYIIPTLPSAHEGFLRGNQLWMYNGTPFLSPS